MGKTMTLMMLCACQMYRSPVREL